MQMGEGLWARTRRGIYWARRRVQGPPIVRDTYMEVSAGPWAGVMHCFDATGRLLGEEHGMAPGQSELPDTRWKTWRPAGSRQGRLFNATAMRAVSRHWAHILADVARLRDGYLARLDHERAPGARSLRAPGALSERTAAAEARSLADAFYVGFAATAIPAYATRRRRDPVPDGGIGEREASLYKVMAGIALTIDPMAERGRAAAYLRDPEPRALVRFIEEEGLFVAPTGHVCSGPERMVETLFAHVLGHARASDGESAPPWASELEAVLDYGIACAKLDLAHQILVADARDRVAGLARSRATEAYLDVLLQLFDHLATPDGVTGRALLLEEAPRAGESKEAVVQRVVTHAHDDVSRLFASACGALGHPSRGRPPEKVLQRRVLRELATRAGPPEERPSRLYSIVPPPA